MADYTIIADVSSFICNMLKKKLCPEPVPSVDNIGIFSPASGDADHMIGLHLYDVKEETLVTQAPCLLTGDTAFTKAPMPYSLSYMVFINASFRSGLTEPDIQKITGRIAQIVSDNDAVSPHELQPWLGNAEPQIVLSQAKMTLNEKMRVWQALNMPYQISLFYKASPVFVSSEITVDPPRVREALFHTDTVEGKGGDEE